jgi:hypothetical protein
MAQDAPLPRMLRVFRAAAVRWGLALADGVNHPVIFKEYDEIRVFPA